VDRCYTPLELRTFPASLGLLQLELRKNLSVKVRGREGLSVNPIVKDIY
jgi:hypothetical protein